MDQLQRQAMKSILSPLGPSLADERDAWMGGFARGLGPDRPMRNAPAYVVPSRYQR